MVLAAKIYTGNDPESEDIVQQVFIKFWEQKLFQNVKVSIKNFLHISVRNACINHLDKKKNLEKRQQKFPEENTVDQAIDLLLNHEEMKVLEKSYSKLSGKSREVLELVYFSDYSYKKAAEELNISLNTVKWHLAHALRMLKDCPILRSYYRMKKDHD